MPQHFLVGNDLHRSATEHKAWPNKHRVPDLGRSLYTIFDAGNGNSGRLRNVKFEQHFFKAVTVFSPLDSGAVGSDEFYTAVHQWLGQIDGCLPTQRSDDSFGFLIVNDRHDIFRCQRLKIELVPGSIIGRDCLRIVVDYDGFISIAFDGLYGVNRGIIKLYALSDADRSCTEHDNLFLIFES